MSSGSKPAIRSFITLSIPFSRRDLANAVVLVGRVTQQCGEMIGKQPPEATVL
jgi:hypothetical protein